MNNSQVEKVVGIDARMLGLAGGAGIETVICGLLTGLGKLDGPEKYVVLVGEAGYENAKSFASENTTIVVEGVDVFRKLRNTRLAILLRLRFMVSLLSAFKYVSERYLSGLPVSSGALERAKCSIVHFPTTDAFLTSLPSIYQPHDLQHRHLTQYFPWMQRRLRDFRYKTWCARSDLIVVGSEWIKSDLRHQYDDIDTRIDVIPLAPDENRTTGEYAGNDTGECRVSFDRFVLYPARTWPHKNHIGLLRAISHINANSSVRINLVCTGAKSEWYRSIEHEIKLLNLVEQVQFTGFVSNEQLANLYRKCDFVVIPTFFEAGSFPMWEAFVAAKAVAISDITSLPAMSGGAARLFDPYDAKSIAESILELQENGLLRCKLAEQGRKRVEQFTWVETAKRYRTRYRFVAGWELDDWDKSIMKNDPLAF